MAGITIQINQADLKAVMGMLDGIKNGSRDALKMAANKALTGTTTDAAKMLSAKLNLTQKVIKQNFTTRKATNADLAALFKSKGRPIPLVDYGARQTLKGVSVQVLKSSPRKVVQRTFLATMKSGHKGVFWRNWHGEAAKVYPRGKKIAWATFPRMYRFKIHELYGPRIEDILGGYEMYSDLQLKAQTRMEKELDAAANYLLLKNAGVI